MTIIVYFSKTGLTKRYAALLAGILHCRFISLDELGDQNLHDCKNLIFMTRLKAGKIEKLGLFRKIVKKFPGRSILVVTGASPADAPTVSALWKSLPLDIEHVPHFYLQAGLNYEGMDRVERAMMNTLKFTLLLRPGHQEQYDQIANSFDTISEDKLQPIVDLIKEKS